MNSSLYANLQITVLGLKAEGQAFEDLFGSILIRRDPQFRKVQAYGNIGDRKNDGFNPNSGIYYQIFAPSDIAKSRTVAAAVSKLEEDFRGLYEHWDKSTSINEFKFVINDKQKGCPPQVEQKMGDLRKEFPNIRFSSFTLDDLIIEFNKLNIDQKQEIVGFIPNQSYLATTTISAVVKTIEHIKSNLDAVPQSKEDFNQEEFNKKIEFNYLGVEIADLMRNAESQTYLLEDFFNRNQDKNLKNVIRDYYSYLYLADKEEFNGINKFSAPIIFFKILNSSAYDKSQDAQNAALILMSLFFISCDIYEKPSQS